jgi:poly(beta-D-mannuronate) lyase
MFEAFFARLFVAPSFKRRLFRAAMLSACLLVATAPGQAAFAAITKVCSSSELSSAIGKAQPGDTIKMCNGNWANAAIVFDVRGTKDLPIRLVAETPGNVVLGGSSRLILAGTYATVDGLTFRGRDTGSGAVIEFRRTSSNKCNDCRITNISMIDFNPSDQMSHSRWVVLHGKRNRVDHSHFKGKNNLGAMVQVHRNADQTPNYHVIDHNFFEDRPDFTGDGNQNGDTLEIGSMGKYAAGESATTVEFNYFLNIDSDFEVITVKSSGNTLRYNVLDSSRGVFSLRQGRANVVYGNVIVGRGKVGTGGIWVSGRDHVITSNYIEGVNPTSVRALAGVLLTSGTDELIYPSGEGTTPYSKFNRAENIKLMHNTIVDSGASLVFGSPYPLPPREIDVMNNIVLQGKGSAITKVLMGPNISFANNLIFGSSTGLSVLGIQLLDPKLIPDHLGIKRPSPESPVIGAVRVDDNAMLDMDGQGRAGASDIGADQVVRGEAPRGPISICGVGPMTYRVGLPPTCSDNTVAEAAAPKPPTLFVN